MGEGGPAAAQGRQDAEAALQEAEEKLAASAAAAAQLEQQLAAAAPAAQAPVMSPAGCAAPATALWTSMLLCACAPLCSRVILRKLWACGLPVIAVRLLCAMGRVSCSATAPGCMTVTWRILCCRRMDSVLKDNDELRSEVCELLTRLENGDRVMQGLQSGREEAERWATCPVPPHTC